MNQQDIIESNKLIAEFMGSKYYNQPYKANKDDLELTDFWSWSKPENGWPIDALSGQEYSTAYMIENWAYHSSWDWLMPVVEKIESMGCCVNLMGKPNSFICLIRQVGIESDFYPISYYYGSNGNEDTASSKIDAVFKSVIQFIKWYNLKK